MNKEADENGQVDGAPGADAGDGEAGTAAQQEAQQEPAQEPGTALIPDHKATVRPEWIDYNGHMNEAFYVLVFGHATDAMMIDTGMGQKYREESGCSLYTVEAHVRYLREVTEGTELTVRTRILGVDAKKVRLVLEMRAKGRQEPVATSELLMIHVDQKAGRAAPFPDAVREQFEALTEKAPPWAGGSISPVPKP